MDGYRQTLLGRALADVLREMEADSSGIDGDEVFAVFDEVMREELTAAVRATKQRETKSHQQAASATAPPTRSKAPATSEAAQDATATAAAPAVFTHQSMEVTAKLESFNRFADDWSLQAAVASGDLVLDRAPVRWHSVPAADEGNGDAAAEQGEASSTSSTEAEAVVLPMLAKLHRPSSGGVK